MILHTEITGKREGTPILFLHAGLETARTDFLEQQTFFSANYKVIAVDMCGHGYSTYSDYKTFPELIAHTAQSLQETLDHLGEKEVHVAGSSFGAMVAIIFANKFPGYVASLCVSGVNPLRTEEVIQGLEEQKEQLATIQNDKMTVRVLTERHQQNDWKLFIEKASAPEEFPFEDMACLPITTEIGRTPTLIMSGEESMAEVEGICYYKQKCPSASVAVIPFAGHLVPQDEPDLYNHVYQSFLRSL
ncbi:alpha/beta fold hydrolase [Shouchella lonarensis]|uniref:Pimeloyl-ACP methyl ester carboxylesterase n=1 Tax=Shouchella lonarensis TaxID=1464122 RepID=A0A1G6HLM6_9BACI|nr:alpha/beta hydrolase [Shouchella lonarensis]SDB95094.1 Pimeloyl-ACP methyl ester carboxylesterase [Shouchella lonarensis]